MKNHFLCRFFVLLSMCLGGVEIAVATGNADAGRNVYKSCSGCHSPAANRTGPKHCGLLGRIAGTAEGFKYSKSMKNAGLTWDTATLNRFIKSPLDVVPGTSMGFAGIKDDKKRADLVAYLVKISDSKSVCSASKSKKSDK